MRPVVIDRVVWFVGQSVIVVSPAKTDESIEMLFGLRTRVGQGIMYYMGSRYPHGKGKFWEKGVPSSCALWGGFAVGARVSML